MHEKMMISKEAILGILVGIVVYSIITKYSDIFNRNNGNRYSARDQEVHHDDTCVYMQQKYNIRTIEAFYALKIDIQERFFKHGCSKILKTMQHDKKSTKASSDNELINEQRKDTNININTNTYTKSATSDNGRKKSTTITKSSINNSNNNKNIEEKKPTSNTADTVTDSAIIRCKEMRDAYHVELGHSWGSLSMEMQKQWSRMRCDLLLEVEDRKVQLVTTNITNTIDTTSTPNANNIINTPSNDNVSSSSTISDTKSTTTTAVVSQKSHGLTDTLSSFFLGSKSASTDQDTLGLFKLDKDNIEWCNDNKAKYDVIPLRSWGRLPMNMVDEWKKRSCDKVFTNMRMSKKKIVTCDPITNTNAKLPLIAVMAASTTRKVTSPSVDNMAIFSFLFPSLIRTLDCNFRYVVVLGYDSNDPFYDTSAGMKSAVKWFDDNIKKVMLARGILIYLKVVKVNNTLRKPGPVFIEMARTAYKEGANYFYRLNDDTELIENWPSIFVNALNSLGKPYGVVGPTCRQGNQKILTHDFVHRLHMEIFEMNYYPTQLTDWWMDDWISYVYGQKRTFKANDVKVIHHTGAHGQRYEVNQENGMALTSLIDQGRRKIRQWMLKNSISERLLTEFDNDVYDQNMVHKDIPKAFDIKNYIGLR